MESQGSRDRDRRESEIARSVAESREADEKALN
jgi:hypothetical protein